MNLSRFGGSHLAWSLTSWNGEVREPKGRHQDQWRRVSPLTRGLKYNYNTNCIRGISVGAKKLYRSKMAANGQLVLPKELRDALGLAGGDVLIIQSEDQGNGLIEITIQRPGPDRPMV